MNPNRLDSVIACGLLLVLLAAIGCTGVGAQPPASADTGKALPFSSSEQLSLPAGTPIYVRLQESVSSRTAQTGQSFSAVLDEPLLLDGQTIAPQGSPVTGRVIAARESGHLHNAGYLRVTLASITMKGKAVPIQASSLFVEGGSFNKRNFAYIGGGAGAGAIIGSLAGGGKGALIGSAIGAGSGTAAAYATGKKEVGFMAERRLGFRLVQPVTLNSQAANGD